MKRNISNPKLSVQQQILCSVSLSRRTDRSHPAATTRHEKFAGQIEFPTDLESGNVKLGICGSPNPIPASKFSGDPTFSTDELFSRGPDACMPISWCTFVTKHQPPRGGVSGMISKIFNRRSAKGAHRNALGNFSGETRIFGRMVSRRGQLPSFPLRFLCCLGRFVAKLQFFCVLLALALGILVAVQIYQVESIKNL